MSCFQYCTCLTNEHMPVENHHLTTSDQVAKPSFYNVVYFTVFSKYEPNGQVSNVEDCFMFDVFSICFRCGHNG